MFPAAVLCSSSCVGGAHSSVWTCFFSDFFIMSVVCFMDRLHHWSNTEADVARVCLVNRLVSLTSCGLWVVQTMQRESCAVHFLVSFKTVAN